jgi:hypothetical protein
MLSSSVEGESRVRAGRSWDHDNAVFEFFAAGPHHSSEFCHFDLPLEDLDDVEAAEHLRQTAIESGDYAAQVVDGLTIDTARRRTLQAMRLALREYHPSTRHSDPYPENTRTAHPRGKYVRPAAMWGSSRLAFCWKLASSTRLRCRVGSHIATASA